VFVKINLSKFEQKTLWTSLCTVETDGQAMHREQTDGDWRGLWEEYGPKLLLFARQQTAQLSDAEDIVQEAFVRCWQVGQTNADLSPGLLFTMVKRIAIDHARKTEGRRQRESQARLLADREEAWFVDPAEEQERKHQIEEALRALPVAQREVLALKIWGGLTFEQIGETLGISPHTAASRYRYALGQLRQVLTPAML
jgi:RNA polymerase sigma-70 factor (ECF subfamily)